MSGFSQGAMRRVERLVPCRRSKCKALRGHRCVTPSGRLTRPHAVRVADANRLSEPVE